MRRGKKAADNKAAAGETLGANAGDALTQNWRRTALASLVSIRPAIRRIGAGNLSHRAMDLVRSLGAWLIRGLIARLDWKLRPC